MKVMLVICLTLFIILPISKSQSSFSPFSLLGSLFSPRGWPVPRLKQLRQLRKLPQSPILFRPHPPVSQKFSASEQVSHIVRFKNILQPSSRSPPQITISPTRSSAVPFTTQSNFTSLSSASNAIISLTSSTVFPLSSSVKKKSGVSIVTTDKTNKVEVEPREKQFPSVGTIIITTKESENDKEGGSNESFSHKKVTESEVKVTTEQSSFSSYPSRESNERSGPNPQEYPIVSLLDQPTLNYYEVINNLSGSENNIPVSFNEITENQEQNHTRHNRFNTKQYNSYIGPYYAPEEFEYTQYDHDTVDEDEFIETVTESDINETTLIVTPFKIQEEEKQLDFNNTREEEVSPPGLANITIPKQILKHGKIIVTTSAPGIISNISNITVTQNRLSHLLIPEKFEETFKVSQLVRSQKGREQKSFAVETIPFSEKFMKNIYHESNNKINNKVNAIEHTPIEDKKLNTSKNTSDPEKERDDVESEKNITVKFEVSSSEIQSSLTSLVNCGAASDVGFCSLTPSYPTERVMSMVQNCSQVLDAFKAVVDQNLDLLGDNSHSVVTSQKEEDRPWSWKVYAYNKKQICDSELYFLQPGFARDTEGKWQVILQTNTLQQHVAIDMCHQPHSPCSGMSDCGKKSKCVQRYNYQLLLSLPPTTTSPTCPTLRTFMFPSGCVCHTETEGTDLDSQ